MASAFLVWASAFHAHAQEAVMPAMPQYFYLADPHTAASQPSVGESVSDRPRPELDPNGKRIRSFFLFPRISLEERFDDNVYATKHDVKTDLITEISPAITATSNWTRHALHFAAQGRIGRFLDHSSEDYNDFSAVADGRLDITRNTNLTGMASFQKQHQPRSSPDEAGGKEPTQFRAFSTTAQLNQLVGRLAFVAQGTFQRLDYQDVQALDPGGGTFTINNNDRNRNVYEGLLGVTYQISPKYKPFMRITANRRDFDSKTDHLGLRRSSHGYDMVAGLDFDLSGSISSEVFGGYQVQHYKDKLLGSPGGLDYGAHVLWNVTGLTSISASARRSIQDTFTARGAAAFLDRFAVSADHELFRNLLLSLSADYFRLKYQNVQRVDNYYGMTLGATYMMNRYLNLNISYAHRGRVSDISAADFDENLVRIRITGQL